EGRRRARTRAPPVPDAAGVGGGPGPRGGRAGGARAGRRADDGTARVSLPELPPARPPTWEAERPVVAAETAREPWTPALAVTCGSAACLVLVVLGVLAARPDVAVLGAAPLVLAVRALVARPTGVLETRFETDDGDD